MKSVLAFGASVLMLTACGSDSPGADAGDATTSDATEDCGQTFLCCTACDDDTPDKAICVNGKRECPTGTSPQSSFVCPCFSVSCTLPPFHASCVACDGGNAPSTCDVDANVFVCPSGMHSVDDLDASCD